MAARAEVTHWLKFNTVGLAGVFVQLAALAIFRGALHLHYLVATALAVEIAVLHNFGWHERWTWKERVASQQGGRMGRLARFHLTNGLLSIGGNIVLMKVLAGWLGLHYLAANGITIGLLSVLNFLAADRLVFKR